MVIVSSWFFLYESFSYSQINVSYSQIKLGLLRAPKLLSLMFKRYLRSIYSFTNQISLIFYQSFEEATSGNINGTERETFSKQLKA